MAVNDSVFFALHDVEEYIRSGKGSSLGGTLYYSPQCNRREKEIISQASRSKITCKSLDEKAFSAKCDSLFGAKHPDGLRHLVLTLSGSYVKARASSSDLKTIVQQQQSADNSIILVLDGITDPHNLGAILRSADLFDVAAVILPKKRSAQVNDTVRKTSAGASHHVPVFYVANLVREIDQLKDAGYWVYCADLGGESPHKQKLAGKTVLVMGSEGSGPSREVLKHADSVVTITSGGHIDSFNVSVATGILLYEIRRQSGFAG